MSVDGKNFGPEPRGTGQWGKSGEPISGQIYTKIEIPDVTNECHLNIQN
jgi:hypothetical protein